MRIALIAIGSTGDVQPMALLGRELMRRGHQVRLSAFSALEPLAARAGLSFCALPVNAEAYIGSVIRPGASPLSFLRRLTGVLRDTIEPTLDLMFEAFQGADAVVCTFCGSTPAAMAAKAGVPLFEIRYVPLDPTGTYSMPIMRGLPFGRACNRAVYRLGFRMIAEIERRYVHPWCSRNGIATAGSQSAATLFYAFSGHVVPRAPGWGEAIRQVGFFLDETETFAPPAALRTFLDAGDAPLYIGFGSMTSGDAGNTLRAVLDALSRTKLRAVLAPGWSGMDTALFPENVYCQKEFIPHGWLFERMRAVVHHGGAGTTASSLRAGVPALIVPFGGDQFFWSERVRALGCGPRPLPRARLTGRALAKRLEALVATDVYFENAARVGAALREESGIRLAAEEIERALGIVNGPD